MDNQSKLVFIDFETFNVNLNFFSNRPWQVGMLKVEGGRLKDAFDEMLRWDSDLKISKEAARITGYNQFVFDKKARPEKEIFQTVYDWLDGSDYIVGHNILGFDLYLMRGWCKMYDKPYNHFFKKAVDTMALARGLKIEMPFKPQENSFLEYQYKMISLRKKGLKTSLGALGKYYNIHHDSSKLHDALEDLNLNFKVWRKIKLDMDRR